TGAARWTIKLGAFYPPVSIENEGVGWTSPWTLTPSAINTWVGEELRTIGGETSVEWKTASGSIGLTGAVFGGNDPTGLLIAARGWSFGDRPTGLFDRVRTADDVALRSRRAPPYYQSEFLEIDDRAGFYGGVSWRENGLGRLTLLRYDNRADPGGSGKRWSPSVRALPGQPLLGHPRRLGIADWWELVQSGWNPRDHSGRRILSQICI
ncbi:MAG: hypothetical protein EBZ36_13940, partial [Acidobacteria bacterium]|nr:hypothetical protein [Acidobacteriota bacterium]